MTDLVSRPLNKPEERFTHTAAVYDRCRPRYPEELVAWTEAVSGGAPPALVADIGCGTGISAQLFADRGYVVIGVDPNEAMLRRAPQLHGKITYTRGSATNTGLGIGTIDLVTCGQALHWFELNPAMNEFHRIMKVAGWAMAFWNVAALTPFMTELEELKRRLGENYTSLTSRVEECLRGIREHPLSQDFQRTEFSNCQTLDGEMLLSRLYSSSFFPNIESAMSTRDEVLALFRKYETQGKCTLDYRTLAAAWRIERPNSE